MSVTLLFMAEFYFKYLEIVKVSVMRLKMIQFCVLMHLIALNK